MLTGQLPWTKPNQYQLFNQIRRGEYRIHPLLSDSCKDVIRKMMNIDPSQRVTIDQVLTLPWGDGLTKEDTRQELRYGVSLKRIDKAFENSAFGGWRETEKKEEEGCISAPPEELKEVERCIRRRTYSFAGRRVFLSGKKVALTPSRMGSSKGTGVNMIRRPVVRTSLGSETRKI